jgi:hypothetical protein
MYSSYLQSQNLLSYLTSLVYFLLFFISFACLKVLLDSLKKQKLNLNFGPSFILDSLKADRFNKKVLVFSLLALLILKISFHYFSGWNIKDVDRLLVGIFLTDLFFKMVFVLSFLSLIFSLNKTHQILFPKTAKVDNYIIFILLLIPVLNILIVMRLINIGLNGKEGVKNETYSMLFLLFTCLIFIISSSNFIFVYGIYYVIFTELLYVYFVNRLVNKIINHQEATLMKNEPIAI